MKRDDGDDSDIDDTLPVANNNREEVGLAADGLGWGHVNSVSNQRCCT